MNKKSIVLSLFSLLFLFSCIKDEEPNIILDANGAYPYVTDVVGGFFNLSDVANASSGFTVNTSTSSGNVSSITVMKSLNDGAKAELTTISGSSGAVSVTLADAVAGLGDVAALALGDAFGFSFVLNMDDGRSLTSPVSVSVPMSCVSDIAGMYSVTAVYGFHDFLADNPTLSSTEELVAIGGGVYSIGDLSGGLYAADGPYGTAYGTAGLAIEFSDICNEISWTGQSDPWGACIPLDGGVNSRDADTGVITISWFCEAYGENGVSVLTPM